MKFFREKPGYGVVLDILKKALDWTIEGEAKQDPECGCGYHDYCPLCVVDRIVSDSEIYFVVKGLVLQYLEQHNIDRINSKELCMKVLIDLILVERKKKNEILHRKFKEEE